MDEQQIEKTSSQTNAFLIPGAIIVAGVFIAGAIMYSNTHGGATGKDTAEIAGTKNLPKIEGDLTDNDPVLGNPQAPITIVEFADFQCPFCGRFFKTTSPQIIDKYVKTGKAKFVYRDFAFLGEESEWAAEAAECAREQDKFWEYHDYLFNHQKGENQGAFAKDHLKRFADTLGLDKDKFNSCLDTDKYLEEVRGDTEAGRTAGVSGTPTTFVNGRAVVGAVPFAQFETIISDALKKGKK